MEVTNQSRLLGAIAGQAGDYYIDTTAVTTKKFSHVIIGPAGATVGVCKIRGIDVIAARNYGELPPGYVMCAGGDDYFDAITLSAGYAQGLIYPETVAPGTLSVVVTGGVAEAAMTPTITYTNTGNGSSKLLDWRVKNSAGVVVQSGQAHVYFLSGTGLTVTIPGLSYFATVGADYTFEFKENEKETYTASAAFNITAE